MAAASTHSPGFQALVDEARGRVKEVPAREIPAILKQDLAAKLIDVREESEYAASHVSGAEWLGKGVIERDIEVKHPDKHEPLYLYCGGGFRSVLAADNLTKMGYTNVHSIDGGWKTLKDLLPVE
jgi:rhodanese-related sulfurtransferase